MDPRSSEFFLLRYVPRLAKSDFVNFGVVVLHHPHGVSIWFTKTLQELKRLDRNLDVQLLHALSKDLRNRLADPENRSEMLRILSQCSNMIQVSETRLCNNSRG